jgi:pimeloyl-ACP methyl ester carboxylesterase
MAIVPRRFYYFVSAQMIMVQASQLLLVMVLIAVSPVLGQAEGGDGILTGLASKTWGGPVAWSDEVIYGDWRIQKHQSFGYYRLLDARERRVATGTMDDCFAELHRRRMVGEIPPMSQHVVVTIHGLAGSRSIMEGLGEYLHEQGGYTVVNFGYASTKGSIQEQALALESVLRNLEGVHEVSFVAHSMGNILVRHVLYRFCVQGNPPPLVFRRMVMISPPNHGAEIADTIGQRPLIQVALGDVIDQFAPDRGWPQLERQLATPDFEFGIIAGGLGNENGFLPRVPGDDDGLLSLQTHMLAGAADFLQTGGLHQIMPRYDSVKKATLVFLKCGHF